VIRRRAFIAGLGSAAVWPIVARAQQGDRVRRIGVLMAFDETDPELKRRYSAFTQALADLGWTDGRNVRMDLRGAGADINRMRALAQELVRLQPDIIVTYATAATCGKCSPITCARRARGQAARATRAGRRRRQHRAPGVTSAAIFRAETLRPVERERKDASGELLRSQTETIRYVPCYGSFLESPFWAP
jgi:hypothetical protein